MCGDRTSPTPEPTDGEAIHDKAARQKIQANSKTICQSDFND
jgi:hypothetical protein